MSQTFEPIQWAVEGLLPRGCWILGGKPKTGKSWLALELLLAVAGGTEFLGREVDDGECLYLALEDSDRRMRERIVQLTGGDYPRERLSRLSYHTDWPKGDDCIKQLRAHLRDHPGTRLVVVDTLARVKPQAAKGSNAYEADYAALAPLQQLAAHKGITLVVVTHVRKQQSDDPFDDITGSLGAQAAVDGTIHLSRHKAGKGQLLMLARGRDLDGDLELILSHSKSGFSSLGNPAGVALDGERKRVVEHLEFVGTDGATASEVHKALGRKDLSGTRKLLERLADEFLVLKREGRYFIAGDDDDVDGDVLAAGVLRNSAGSAAAGARA
jgi:predicted ATP-dependent serine protease